MLPAADGGLLPQPKVVSVVLALSLALSVIGVSLIPTIEATETCKRGYAHPDGDTNKSCVPRQDLQYWSEGAGEELKAVTYHFLVEHGFTAQASVVAALGIPALP